MLSGTRDPDIVVSDNEAALLSAEAAVFPLANRIIYRWQVNNNITKNCKKKIAGAEEGVSDQKTSETLLQDWNQLCTSSTTEVFQSLWEEFKDDYAQHPSVISYLESTWMVHKEKIMDPWVGRLLRFGCTTTSRAESSNAFLKKFLSSSVGNLLTVVRQLNQSIEHQIVELRKVHADDRIKRLAFCSHPLYTEVVYKVSSFTLTKVHEHHQHHNKQTLHRHIHRNNGTTLWSRDQRSNCEEAAFVRRGLQ